MNPRQLRGKKVLVAGLGLNKGGVATVRYLARRGARVTVTDLRSKHTLRPSLDALSDLSSITYILGRHTRASFENADLIFQNPGMPSESEYLSYARNKNVPITNEAAYFLKYARCKVVGVTGTRGKSTTCALLSEIISESKLFKRVYLTGNIAQQGLLEVLERAKEGDIAIAELSSFQLELTELERVSPDIAVITSLYNDHMNRYSSVAAYHEAKKNIIRFQDKHDTAILNADQAAVKKMYRNTKARVYYTSLKKKVRGAYIKNNEIIWSSGAATESVFSLKRIRPQARVIVDNFLPVVAVSKLLNVDNHVVIQGIENYKGLPYRMQDLGTRHGVRIINDSCATAPIATERALKEVGKKCILIAGGVNKDLSYKTLARKIQSSAIRTILLPGSATDILEEELMHLGYKSITHARTLKHAVDNAFETADAGTTILFSPAAASFNLFLNEFDRGKQFDALIEAR